VLQIINFYFINASLQQFWQVVFSYFLSGHFVEFVISINVVFHTPLYLLDTMWMILLANDMPKVVSIIGQFHRENTCCMAIFLWCHMFSHS